MDRGIALAQINLLAQIVLDEEEQKRKNEKVIKEHARALEATEMKNRLPEYLQPFFTGINDLGEGHLEIPGYETIRISGLRYCAPCCIFSEDIAWVLARAKKLGY
jgi:hypothetical protein